VTVSKAVKDLLKVGHDEQANLKKRDPAWAGPSEYADLAKGARSELSQKVLAESREAMGKAQELLYANQGSALLIIFQALDAAGKDSTIKHVMSGVNPQGCEVTAFKAPVGLELQHDFLWRSSLALPRRGHIGIFNRSHYEELLVPRIHPEMLDGEALREHNDDPKEFWAHRTESICDFERHLVRNDTVIVKFFLHVSKDEQRRRLLSRLDNPAKRWKFSMADITEREHFEEYLDAYEDVITKTSTQHAPWYVIPADNKPLTRMLVAEIITDSISSMDLSLAEARGLSEADYQRARKQLVDEDG
jgi:PPK2 family polyphosphate:nucleotide phosphotransferase